MKKEQVKKRIPDNWDLSDALHLKDYYNAISEAFEGYRILGFIKYCDHQEVVLEKC